VTRAGLAALFSHWRRQPIQLAMLLLGLSIATALWTGVQAINAEARQSYARAASTVGADAARSLVRKDGGPIDLSRFVELRRAGWLVSPLVEGETMFGSVRVRLVGIEPLTLPREAGQVTFEGDSGLADFLGAPGAMYVDADLAARLSGLQTPRMLIGAEVPPDTAIIDIGLAQVLLGRSGIDRLILARDQPSGVRPLAEIAPELVEQAPAASNDLSRLTDSFHLNLTAFGLLSFVVGLFIVYASIGLAFEQRRPMFRTMRALGLSGRRLMALLLGELLILSILAGVVGVLLGYLVAAALLPGVAATLRGLYGASVSGALSLSPGWWVAGIGISVLGALASAAESLWRMMHMPLLASAQPRSWARASQQTMMVQAFVALALLAAGYALYVLGSGLLVGFAILGALLLGSALLLPICLHVVVGWGQRLARGPMTQWFWADTRQQLPGLSIALMALLLALATNVGVGTMVSSFRQTFTGYLDQRLAAELYIRAGSNEEAARMADWLAPRVDAVLPLWRTEARLFDLPGDIVSAADHATFRDNWPMLEGDADAWDRIARGEAVLANEQLARRAHLEIGDTIPLPGGWAPVLAGVYSDYGNPGAQVIAGLAAMQQRYPGADHSQLGVRVDPARADTVRKEFEATFRPPPNTVIDQAGLKRFSLEVFERTFLVTGALNVLTLGVAGFALFASLMTLSGMRLPQLAPVWALGLSRRGLAMLEMVRTLALSGLTTLAAIPVGLGLAWVLLSVVNVEAFGWRLPMYLFPLDWIRLGLLALAAAGVAALFPVRRLARMPPAELLKVFAHER
jgi:putative ABC transport system permease protein